MQYSRRVCDSGIAQAQQVRVNYGQGFIKSPGQVCKPVDRFAELRIEFVPQKRDGGHLKVKEYTDKAECVADRATAAQHQESGKGVSLEGKSMAQEWVVKIFAVSQERKSAPAKISKNFPRIDLFRRSFIQGEV